MGKKRKLESDHERKSEHKKHKVSSLFNSKHNILATSTDSVSLTGMVGNLQNLRNPLLKSNAALRI